MNSLKIAIIGCGAIGEILAKSVDMGEAGKTELEVLYDLDEEQAEELGDSLSSAIEIANNVEEILEDDSVDLVVEAASQEAVSEYSKDILNAGKDLVVLSVGAFSDQELFEEVQETAENSGNRVYVPSGAILGLDGVQAAQIAGIDEATLTTKKPPEALSNADYVKRKNIEIDNLTEPKVIFEGTAREAAEAFPKSLNVAASLSLTGAGLEKTQVRIIADPSLNQNFHEIEIKGEAGELSAKAHNFPSPDNPKTSYLAALSTIRLVRNLTEPVKIGT